MLTDLLASKEAEEDPLLPTTDRRSQSPSKIPFGVPLGVVKSLRVFGLFLLYDLLKSSHLIPGLFLIQFM